MTEPKGKTNMQLYNEALALRDEEAAKCKAMPDFNKDGKTPNKLKAKKKEKIAAIDAEIERLEPIKNEEQLSETCKKYLVALWAGMRYKRRKEIVNKYILKGLEVEENSITALYNITGGVYFKNEEHFKNEYIQGTPDIVEEDEVIDIKSSWDISSFLARTVEDIDPMYYWQGQGYMALTARANFRLTYILINTPDALIEQEKRSLMYKFGKGAEFAEEYHKACEELERNMIFDDIPLEERMIAKYFERNDMDIQRLYRRIEKCRQWLNGYDAEQEKRFEFNRSLKAA